MDVPVDVMALKTHRKRQRLSLQIQGQLGGYFQPTGRARLLYRRTLLSVPRGASPPRTSAPNGRSRCTTITSSIRSSQRRSDIPQRAVCHDVGAVYQRNGGGRHAARRHCGRETAWDRIMTRPTSIWTNRDRRSPRTRSISRITIGTSLRSASCSTSRFTVSCRRRNGSELNTISGKQSCLLWGSGSNTGGLMFVCTTAGTSGATPPTAPTTAPGR